MGRCPCCDKTKVKRGLWSPDEDAILKNYIQRYGAGGNWITLPHRAGLRRCGKSCRLRWLNYLRPGIKHGGFTEEEDNIILNLYHSIGSRWSVIASHLEGRTDNEVKNYWNTKLKKKKLQLDAGNPTQNSNTTTTTTATTAAAAFAAPVIFLKTCNTVGTSNIVSSFAFATDRDQLCRTASTYYNGNGNSSSDYYSQWSSDGVLQQQETNTGYYYCQQDHLAPQLIHEVSAEETGTEPSATCSSGGGIVLVEPSQPVPSHFPLENKYGSSSANGGGEIDHAAAADDDAFLMSLVESSAGFSIDDLLNGLI